MGSVRESPCVRVLIRGLLGRRRVCVCVCVCVCIDGDEGIKSGGVKGAVLPRFMLCNMSFGRG
jgi:hypothetical protein